MLVCDIDRAYGGAAGSSYRAAGALRRAGRAERVIGMGMDSTERGVDPRDSRPPFGWRARRIPRTSHAGEDTGPENIAIALDALGIERIDHGLAILGDKALTRRVADARIPLTVCPNSNIVIANRYDRLEDHPFRRMRQAGLLATLNTDDPAMTDLDLGKEYRTVAAALRMPWTEVVAVALDGVEATWLDDAEKAALRRTFERELAALRPADAERRGVGRGKVESVRAHSAHPRAAAASLLRSGVLTPLVAGGHRFERDGRVEVDANGRIYVGGCPGRTPPTPPPPWTCGPGSCCRAWSICMPTFPQLPSAGPGGGAGPADLA